jgi:hypothetical protein
MEPSPFEPSVLTNKRGDHTEPPERWDRTMSKYERRIFLDRLIDLREAYQSALHEPTSMGIAGAMAYAAALYDDAGRLDAILAGSSDPASTSSTPA